MPVVRNEEYWRITGWRVFRICVTAFGILGLLAGLSVARSGGEVTLGQFAVSGWQAIWVVVLLMALAGGLFGAVWLIIFRALALASRS